MSGYRDSLPLTGKILLLVLTGGILFGCGLLVGAAVVAILTRPVPLRSPSGPAGSALSHPARPGVAVRAGDMEIRVTDTLRPADDVVAKGNMFNPRPGPGNEMMLVTVSVTCYPEEGDDTCTFAPVMDFLLVSPVGVHRPEWVAGLPHLLQGGEMAAGETLSGDLVFEVGKEETGLVLVYAGSWRGETAYFEVP